MIIETPDYAALLEEIDELEQVCKAYADHKRLYAAPSYIRAFFKSCPDHAAEDIQQRVEQLVEAFIQFGSTRNPLSLEPIALDLCTGTYLTV